MISPIAANIGTAGVVALSILGGAIAIALGLIVPLVIHNKKANREVEATSPYIQAIKAISEKYRFVKIRQTSDSTTYYLRSKRQFDTFDPFRKGDQFILENERIYLPIVEGIEDNKQLLVRFRDEIKPLKPTTDPAIVKDLKMSFKSFSKRECKIASRLVQDVVGSVKTDFRIRISWQYRSPAGRNFYSNYTMISYDRIKRVLLPRKERKITATIYYPNNQNQSPMSKKPRDNTKKVTIDDIPEIPD